MNENVSLETLRSALVACGPRPLRVLFVCLGNICRSPAAEGVLRDMAEKAGVGERLIIDSAGIYSGHQGELPDKRMRVHAQRRGYNLTHRSRPIREYDFYEFDVIVAMDDSNLYDLRSLAPTLETEEKVLRMIDFCRACTRCDCVPDPYYEGAEGFEKVLDLLEDGCRTMLEALHD